MSITPAFIDNLIQSARDTVLWRRPRLRLTMRWCRACEAPKRSSAFSEGSMECRACVRALGKSVVHKRALHRAWRKRNPDYYKTRRLG